MKNKGLIVAVLVLGALSGALYWSNRHPPVDDAAKAAASTSINILSLDRNDISKVEISQKDGSDVVLAKSGTDKWNITAPKPLIGDQDQISTLLTALSPITTDRVIDEKASDLKEYGLADPLVKVSTTNKDGKSHELLIGDDTPTGGSAYAMLEGDPRVFTVSSFTKTSLNKSVNDLRDKHLLPVDYDKINRVELAGPKLDIAFGQNDGQWVVQNPKDVRADTSKFETILDKLRAAVMDPTTSEGAMKKAAAAFAGGTPVITVKVTGPSGSDEMQVRKNKDAYYAKSSAVQGVYTISSDLGNAIGDQNLNDFRNRNLLNPATDDPSKIELRVNGKSYSLARSGMDWTSAGKKMDFTTIENLLNSIRQLAGTNFVTSGFATPSVTLTVTSGDGKQIEKVEMAKNGKSYIARRDDDPLLYEVSEQSVNDLQKAADGMKPVAASQK